MGTLDPKVTGVLPITLGRACKLAGYFIKHDKSYVGILHTHEEQDIEKLQKLIDENFSGKILQTPPHRSAVKREEREREVYGWKLLEALAPQGVPSQIQGKGGLGQTLPPAQKASAKADKVGKTKKLEEFKNSEENKKIIDESVFKIKIVNIGSGKAEIGIELNPEELKKAWDGIITDITE